MTWKTLWRVVAGAWVAFTVITGPVLHIFAHPVWIVICTASWFLIIGFPMVRHEIRFWRNTGQADRRLRARVRRDCGLDRPNHAEQKQALYETRVLAKKVMQ